MNDSATRPRAIPEITPLEDRAIRRFEHDREFFDRVHVEADNRRQKTSGLEVHTALQDAMRDFQAADEEKYGDDAIIRGARYVGNELLGVPYALASIPEQEGLKAAVRRVIQAVDGKE
jgi:hypothetical protein